MKPATLKSALLLTGFFSSVIVFGAVHGVTLASTPATAPILDLNAPLTMGLTCPAGSPLWRSSNILPPVYGVIVSFIPASVAKQRILNTERNSALTIDPAYTNNQRVSVEDIHDRRYLVLVPSGMVVHLGEAVSFIPGHGDPDNLCVYTPNLIVR